MKKAKKVIAILSVVIFLFFLVFSMAGLIVSVHHDCLGAHCPVCARIAVITSAIHIIKACMFMLIILGTAPTALRLCAEWRTRLFRYFTEITLKTRLNN